MYITYRFDAETETVYEIHEDGLLSRRVKWITRHIVSAPARPVIDSLPTLTNIACVTDAGGLDTKSLSSLDTE